MQQTFLSSTFFGLQLDLPTNFREGRIKMYVELQIKTKVLTLINKYFAKLLIWKNRTKLGVRSLYNFWKKISDLKKLEITVLEIRAS